MIVVAVTGGIGSGKSTVAALLELRGAVVIDADQIARRALEPGERSYQAIVAHFGQGVVGADGTLDRAAVAARVFSNPVDLAALNAITHPAIAAAMSDRVLEYAGTDRVVVLDIPLMDPATKGRYGLNGVIVVDVPIELAVSRLVEMRGLAESDARARVAAQMGREERRRIGDVILDNTGSPEALEGAVSRVWTWIEGLAAGQRGEGG